MFSLTSGLPEDEIADGREREPISETAIALVSEGRQIPPLAEQALRLVQGKVARNRALIFNNGADARAGNHFLIQNNGQELALILACMLLKDIARFWL